MKWLRGFAMTLSLAAMLSLAACQNKEKSEIEFEVNDTEHEIEWETTE